MKIDKTNYMLQAWIDMRGICALLFAKTHITYFKYIRFYQDDSMIVLDTHPKTLNYIFEQQLYFKPTDLSTSNRYLFMSAALPKTTNNHRVDVLKAYREKFNIENLFAINQQQYNYRELFIFGSRNQHHKIIEFYLNNMPLLEKFSDYFLQQANEIINKAEMNKIPLPDLAGDSLCASPQLERLKMAFTA